MLINFEPNVIRRTQWHEYALRFGFGGAITVIAGLIASKFGPSLGGLFLAFPAIFPAAATLAQKHEIEKKRRKGLGEKERGADAAGAEAAGTALGSIGLVAFACVFWWLIPRLEPKWIVFCLALSAWAVVSVALWFARKRLRLTTKTKHIPAPSAPPRSS